MESIRVSQAKGKEEHRSLTDLLDLKDFQVIGYEIELLRNRNGGYILGMNTPKQYLN